MSTSIALVTCAAVSSERRMCSAIPRRIAFIGSTTSPPSACGGPGGGCADAGSRRGAGISPAGAAAAAGDGRRVDAVLGGDPGDDRRDEGAVVAVVRLRLRGRDTVLARRRVAFARRGRRRVGGRLRR